MLNKYLHIMDWKVEGKWNLEEVLIDYSVFSTVLWVITSCVLYAVL